MSTRRIPALLIPACFLATLPVRADDPWPFWQRTASRIGRTDTIGPRTPRIAWRLRIDPSNVDAGLESSCVLGANGRLYVGAHRQLTCVDLARREILWGFRTPDVVFGTPALWQGRVLFGYGSSDDAIFYCVDAETGAEVWRRFIPGGSILSSPVVDGAGRVFFRSGALLFAHWVSDGSEAWTRDMRKNLHTSPSLESPRFSAERLLIGSIDFASCFAFDPRDGHTLWQFPLQGFPEAGVIPVEASRAYIGTSGGPFDRHVYCVDTTGPRQVWRYDGSGRDIRGSIALGHPEQGRVYALAVGDWLLCLNAADGSEIWRAPIGTGLAKYAPIVDGRETIYFGVATIDWRVWAVRPDGTRLWTREMPERVFPSPVIGPDGTLYVVCSDKYLYAFRDLRGDMNCDMQVNAQDIDGFILALLDPKAYEALYTDCNRLLADLNEDGSVDYLDIDPFIDCLVQRNCR